MSRTKLGAGTTTHLTLKLPEELKQRLRARAEVTGESVGEILRNAAEAWLRRFEK